MIIKVRTLIFLFTIGANTLPLTSSAKVQAKFFDVKRLRAHKKLFIKQKYKRNTKGTLKRSIPLENQTVPHNWMNLDPKQNSIQGVSSYKASKIISNSNPRIIVAVIDSGVDVNHEDLDGQIWINKNEIPNNNIDDDKNGYIDDIYGWNFIGHANGNAYFEEHSGSQNKYKLVEGPVELQVDADSLSVTREYIRLNKKRSEDSISSQETALLKKLKNEIEFEFTYANNSFQRLQKDETAFTVASKILRAAGLKDTDLATVSRFLSLKPEAMAAKKVLLSYLEKNVDLDYIISEKRYYSREINFHYNTKTDPRQKFVGDDYMNLNEIGYGNNNVIGPGSEHGTHVAGIIAAKKNDLGIDGVAQGVLIMPLRAIPDGDERDKDVAAAIYYAVNNGAQVINMSFGKSYSPNKLHVQKAIQYAEINNVLIVHAAGNENINNDKVITYPYPFINGVRVLNWLEIGASGPDKNNSLAADFSNFGQNTVDFFAPGVDIKSTIPGNDYEYMSGTSMAAPVTAGVVAMILGEFPNLSVVEARAAIINNLNKIDRLYVLKPGLGNVSFSTLSKFSGIPNLYQTLMSLFNRKTLLAFNTHKD
jgi:subtilisin family serine protease